AGDVARFRAIERGLDAERGSSRAFGGLQLANGETTIPQVGHKCQKNHCRRGGFLPELPKRPIARSEGTMFRTKNFGSVEAALVQSYRIPKAARGAFRGKLGALQKQGIFGARNMPGKGVALGYGPDQFHRLVFACEMFEFGVAPSVVLSLVKLLW